VKSVKVGEKIERRNWSDGERALLATEEEIKREGK